MEYWKILDLADIVYTNELGIECVEKWKEVVGWEKYYNTSTLGRMKSLYRVVHSKCGQIKHLKPKILKHGKDKDGYHQVSLCAEGRIIKRKTHRIVAEAFIPNPENKPEVNHKKGFKWDNRVSELEWATEEENREHARIFGLRDYCFGEKHPLSTLTEKDVLEIRALAGTMTHDKIASSYKTQRPNVTDIINRKTWKHI